MSHSAWCTALCSVVFDLKLGQRVEHIVPCGALTAKEQTDVAFHSFPDTTSQELRVCASLRDTCFFFRVRRKRVLYGFVFCRYRQDSRLARGVDRRGVVVISPYPFSSVFKPLATFLGALYFSEGTEALENIYSQILTWSAPQSFKLLQLPVAGHVIQTQLPPFAVFPPPSPISPPAIHRKIKSLRNGISQGASLEHLGSSVTLFNEVDVMTPFRNVLSRLWSLWEMSITAQPLMIVAPSPVECSAAVSALISLMGPIPYASDFRPYFTIHDPEFATLLKMQDSKETLQWDQPLPTMIGVTNLYFIKALPFWPNVLSIGERPLIQRQSQHSGNPKNSFKKFLARTALQSFKSKTLGAKVLLSHPVENLWSRQKPLVKPDLELCKYIHQRAGNPNEASKIIRRHFLQLTTAFLEPFRGYFVPIKGLELTNIYQSRAPSLEVSGLPEFDPGEFLSSILDWPFPKWFTNRFHAFHDLVRLYEQFLASPNFKLWFDREQKMIATDLGLPQPKTDSEEQRNLFIEEPEPVLPSKTRKEHDEVQLVEEFRRLQSKLMNEMYEISPDGCDLRSMTTSEKDFLLVFTAMPDDLRRVLLSSPAQEDFRKRLGRIPDFQSYLHELSEFVM